MTRLSPSRLFFFLVFPAILFSPLAAQLSAPIPVARRVADRVIQGGVGPVSFRRVPAASQSPAWDPATGGLFYSLATAAVPGADKGGLLLFRAGLRCLKDILVRFLGDPRNPALRLFVEGRLVLGGPSGKTGEIRLAGGGVHTLLLAVYLPPGRTPPVRFRILEKGRESRSCRIVEPGGSSGGPGGPWVCLGPLPAPGGAEKALEGARAAAEEGNAPWKALPALRVPVIGRPFTGWIYPEGVLLYALAQLAQETGDRKYKDYLASWWGTARRLHPDSLFLARNAPWIRGPYWVRFKRRALDDTGAMGVAAAEAFFLLRDPFCRETALDMARYAHKEQTRLPGGTFDRVDGAGGITLWVDDLYMGCPVMVRRWRITREADYLEDAARQILGMARRLQRPDGLFMHGMRLTEKKKVPWAWGRGNGWAMVAETEVLGALGGDHPLREKVLQVYRRHAGGILPLQSRGGMWRQVLDLPQSWEETSSTAMFVLSLARGVRRGWLEGPMAARAARAAEAGWKGLAARVSRKGSVRGICVGTNLGKSLEDYLERPERVDDLHGLGPVILAGVEVRRMRASPGGKRR